MSTFSYTSKNQLSVKTDPLGNQFTYSYSATGNNTEVSFAGGSGGGGGGGGGKLMSPTTGADGPGGGMSDLNWVYGFDALNRKVTATDPLGGVMTFQYDAAGREIAVTDRLNHTVTSAFDADNRLIATTDALGDTTSFGYLLT